MPTEICLAVVVPAYRGRFLGDALASLAAQTDRRFRVYVGDDASPDDLGAIVRAYQSQLDIVYRRFETNCGGADLVGQWERCVALTRGEPWLWLFSDDDVAEPGCVAGFHAALDAAGQAPVDVLGFDLTFIDEQGRVTHQPAPHPAFESAEALFRAMLIDRARKWRMPDHVFSRAAFERHGGFHDFPLAIYTDCASWLACAAPRGVRAIAGAKVRWRSYAAGTSSGRLMEHRTGFFAAVLRYMDWLHAHAAALGGAAPRSFARHGPAYFLRELAHFQPALTRQEREGAAAVARRLWPRTRFTFGLHLSWLEARLRLRYWPGLQAVARWRMRRHFRG